MKKCLSTLFPLFFLILFGFTELVQGQALKSGKNIILIETGHHKDVTLATLIERKAHRPQKIKASVFIPNECGNEKKIPAIIIDHDSGGPEKNFYKKFPLELAQNGFVVVVPDHYSTRGIRTTAGLEQGKLSYGARFNDVMQTLNATAALPCVDPKRIGITGYSIGGGMAMLGVERRYTNLLAGGLRFKAAMPVYPGCERVQRNTSPTGTKVLIVGAQLDTLTPFSTCRKLLPYYQKNGWKISLTELDGAYHNFIADTPPKRTNSASFAKCGLRWMELDGSITAEKFGINIKTETPKAFKELVNAAIKSGCVKRGYIYGGTTKDRALIRDLTIDFFKNNL